jgi:hypothetical protein
MLLTNTEFRGTRVPKLKDRFGENLNNLPHSHHQHTVSCVLMMTELEMIVHREILGVRIEV